jgi:DNA-binding transcriptional MerR regulator
MGEALRIGEVAAQTGIQVSAIRYYESLGLLPIPRRVSTHRVYVVHQDIVLSESTLTTESTIKTS